MAGDGQQEKGSELLRPNFTEVILDSIADGVFTVDRQWLITSFNRAAEEITGIDAEHAVGCPCHTVFRASICETGCALRETMATGERVVDKEISIVRPDGQRVPISISTAVLRDEQGHMVGGVETFRDLSAYMELRERLIQGSSFQDIISRDHEMRRLFSILPDIASSESTVLIQGPSGTGKELVARAIHDLSPRRNGPLVVVNCGAMPDTLLESELFGYKAGAFTDAKRDKPGKFALASGGTIFLDEVGDVSPALQTRLLRVLQERVYEPLGDTRPRKADVRVVAATNRNLMEMMEKGRFREDLFYRLSVVELCLPPLADRKEDIPLLAEHFVKRLRKQRSKEISGVSDEAMAVLLLHDFPGNVRELENVIEYAFILCPGGRIRPEHLPDRLGGQRYRARDRSSAERSGGTIEEMEARLIAETLERNGFKRLKTASELGISKSTLWRKMKRYGIVFSGSDG